MTGILLEIEIFGNLPYPQGVLGRSVHIAGQTDIASGRKDANTVCNIGIGRLLLHNANGRLVHVNIGA